MKTVFIFLCVSLPLSKGTPSSISSRFLEKFFADEFIRKAEIKTNSIWQKSDILKKGSELKKVKKNQACSLPICLREEIASYQNVTNWIIHEGMSGEFMGKTYKDLSYFVDKFGSRLTGTKNLEDAIDFMIDKLKSQGMENVHGEAVTVPHWVRYATLSKFMNSFNDYNEIWMQCFILTIFFYERGEESAELIEPRRKKLSILGLGYTIGTPPEGIEAEVLVVKSFADLTSRANDVRIKIIFISIILLTPTLLLTGYRENYRIQPGL